MLRLLSMLAFVLFLATLTGAAPCAMNGACGDDGDEAGAQCPPSCTYCACCTGARVLVPAGDGPAVLRVLDSLPAADRPSAPHAPDPREILHVPEPAHA